MIFKFLAFTVLVHFFLFLFVGAALSNDQKKMVQEEVSKRFLFDLVDLAFDKDRQTLKRIEAAKVISHSQWEQAKSKFLPSLYSDFAASAGEQSPGVSLKEGYDNALSIGIEYGIDLLGIDRRRVDAANIRLQNQEKLSQREQEDILRNIVISFLQWSATCNRLTARQEQLELIRNQYQLLKRQFEQGLKTMRDFARIQSELKRTEMEAFVVQQSLKTDEHRILKIIGSGAAKIDFNCDSAVDYKTVLDMDFALMENDVNVQKLPVAKSVLLKTLDEAENQARVLELEALNRELKLPKVSLFVESGYGATDFLGPQAQNYEETDYWKWRIGLKFSYTIWDGGLSRAKYKEALAQSELQILKNSESILTSDLEIESNRLNLQSAKSEWLLRKDIFSFEQKSLSLVQSDYKQGRADYLELMDSLQKNIQSRIGLGDAAFDYAAARCKVASDMGLLQGYFEKGRVSEKR